MIAMFSDGDEVFVVGLDENGDFMDADGTLFGPDSGRDINDFMRVDVNLNRGAIGHIEIGASLHVRSI